MKITDKNIKKSVEAITNEYNRTLTKAIVDLMKLTGCRSGENFSFEKPIVITSGKTWGHRGVRLSCDLVLINGISFHEKLNDHGDSEISYLEALYDGECTLVSFYFHTEDYKLIYDAVLKAVKAY